MIRRKHNVHLISTALQCQVPVACHQLPTCENVGSKLHVGTTLVTRLRILYFKEGIMNQQEQSTCTYV